MSKSGITPLFIDWWTVTTPDLNASAGEIGLKLSSKRNTDPASA